MFELFLSSTLNSQARDMQVAHRKIILVILNIVNPLFLLALNFQFRICLGGLSHPQHLFCSLIMKVYMMSS